ncbi:hypothetical protein SKAU_G00196620 [Synaphobranchus kaupii]|uniref:THAP-type domain-containing protein n=1 Tax=Synaphobranchus kaupii TaxID=118154 RepID=A0A9Q1FEL1_SYNKA|nr:hypothetical protein SKAU_G00196620 [Synaphobranchus kaupii]
MKRTKTCNMKNTAIKFQRRAVSSSAHCCVLLCSSSAKFSYLSFHSFPANDYLRKKWLINIRRYKFTITSSSKVCGKHFLAEDLVDPTPGGLRRLKKGAVPLLFQWNNYVLPSRLPSVWERRERSTSAENYGDDDDADDIHCAQDHDYCAVPDPAVVDLSLDLARTEKEEMQSKIAKLTAELEEMTVRSCFGLQRFAGSAEDIYDSTLATARIVRVTQATRASQKDEEVTLPSKYSRQALQPVDELFLFLTYLTFGLKLKDLGHRFNVHPSTVSRIIITWANFLYSLVGSISIWLSEQEVKDNLPKDFESYPDTHIVIDCTELRCQTPSSLLLQRKVYCPPFLSQQSQMPTLHVHQTQEIAHLRIHIERVIRRVKENKLFDTTIPLTIAGSINQLFTVACLLSNYQCRALVEEWAKDI